MSDGTFLKSSKTHYGVKLRQSIANKGTHLMLGLDPNLNLIPAVFLDKSKPAVEIATEYCSFVLNVVHSYVVGVKLQSAFFEIFGSDGIAALQHLAHRGAQLGLVVVLDVKRGDVPSTAAAYAAAYLGNSISNGLHSDADNSSVCNNHLVGNSLSGRNNWEIDAITVHPFFGFDTIVPFVEAAKASGKGIYVCVKTSNLGSVNLQSQKIDGGSKLFIEIAKGLKNFHNELYVKEEKVYSEVEGKAHGAKGVSSLGVVTGATFPKDAEEIKEILPSSPLLVPGFGAQGGSLETLSAFRGNSSLFPLSRALMYPWLFENKSFSTDKLQVKRTGGEDSAMFSQQEVSEKLTLAATTWSDVFKKT